MTTLQLYKLLVNLAGDANSLAVQLEKQQIEKPDAVQTAKDLLNDALKVLE